MPEPLLAALKICCLALLYLFFLRVLRAVWAEVNPARAVPVAGAGAGVATRAPGAAQAQRGRGRRRAATHLVVVEPPEHRGRSYPLAEELTVGRATGCQISLDDSYVSQLHARVYQRDGILYVEDLGSTNGTFLGTKKVSSATPMKRGDKLKVGSTVLEVAG